MLLEARSMLQSAPREPQEEAQEIRAVLRRSLGSGTQVDEALTFLRQRRPLCEEDTDNLVLQIEISDHFGDACILVLPLLERYIVLAERLIQSSELLVGETRQPCDPSRSASCNVFAQLSKPLFLNHGVHIPRTSASALHAAMRRSHPGSDKEALLSEACAAWS